MKNKNDLIKLMSEISKQPRISTDWVIKNILMMDKNELRKYKIKKLIE